MKILQSPRSSIFHYPFLYPVLSCMYDEFERMNERASEWVNERNNIQSLWICNLKVFEFNLQCPNKIMFRLKRDSRRENFLFCIFLDFFFFVNFISFCFPFIFLLFIYYYFFRLIKSTFLFIYSSVALFVVRCFIIFRFYNKNFHIPSTT